MRSLGWVLIQDDWCPYGRVHLDPETAVHREADVRRLGASPVTVEADGNPGRSRLLKAGGAREGSSPTGFRESPGPLTLASGSRAEAVSVVINCPLGGALLHIFQRQGPSAANYEFFSKPIRD